MSWATVKDAVRRAVALAARAQDYAGADSVTMIKRCNWEGQASASHFGRPGQQPVIELQMGDVVGLHQDERRTEFISTGPTPDLQYVKPTYTGNRLFTVRVAIDTDSQDDDSDALGVRTGALRTRMRRDEVAEILRAGNVAIVDIGNTINADFVNEDGRQQSRAITDIRFATTESDFDLTPTGDWIHSAAGQGELEGDVGDTLVDTNFDTAA